MYTTIQCLDLATTVSSNALRNDTTPCQFAGIVFCGQAQLLPMDENMNDYKTKVDTCVSRHKCMSLALVTRNQNKHEMHHNAKLLDLQPSMEKGTVDVYSFSML